MEPCRSAWGAATGPWRWTRGLSERGCCSWEHVSPSSDWACPRFPRCAKGSPALPGLPFLAHVSEACLGRRLLPLLPWCCQVLLWVPGVPSRWRAPAVGLGRSLHCGPPVLTPQARGALWQGWLWLPSILYVGRPPSSCVWGVVQPRGKLILNYLYSPGSWVAPAPFSQKEFLRVTPRQMALCRGWGTEYCHWLCTPSPHPALCEHAVSSEAGDTMCPDVKEEPLRTKSGGGRRSRLQGTFAFLSLESEGEMRVNHLLHDGVPELPVSCRVPLLRKDDESKGNLLHGSASSTVI